jgi:hypothetical protein
MILVRTGHTCLRVGRHSWYQSHYGYNISRTVLFLKTAERIRLDAHIRTIVVLTGGKLTKIYFLQFSFCNDAPTPREEGKYPPAG